MKRSISITSPGCRMVEYGLISGLLFFSAYCKDSAGATLGCINVDHMSSSASDLLSECRLTG